MSGPVSERNRRLLVVDDNRAIHADFRKILCHDEEPAGQRMAAAETALFGPSAAPAAANPRAGFTIDTACQGKEALTLVEEAVRTGRPYALAFVDVRMPPGWDGIETTLKLWEADPDLQVVICTAYSDYSWEDMLARLGGSDRMVILKKPFDSVEVLQLAHALTEKWQLLQDSKQRCADLERLVAERTRALTNTNALLEFETRGHKRAAEALLEQAMLLDLASDAIFVRNLENRVQFWNRGAERLYGWTAAEAISGAVAQTTQDFFANAAGQEALLKRGEWSGEIQRTTKAGARVTVTSRWTLLRDNEGRPKSILVIDTDVTEKKKLEAQFLRTQRMEAIGTLATGMAHDLNNILAPVMMAAEMLRWPLAPKDFEETLKRIETSTKRGAEIIKQVLTFGRGAEGKRVLLQPRHLIDEMVTMARQTFPKTIAIESQAPADLWNIEADRTQIHQVLLNLCVNARDAMQNQEGKLTLSAENLQIDDRYAWSAPEIKPGPYIMVRVADTGAGIPPEIIERIFDPFFTTKAQGKGTGLGLSTAIGIIKGHHGAITVSSELKKGTVFTVLLPASPDTRTLKRAAEAAPAALPQGRGDTILLVDDEPEILTTNQKILERFNYKVLIAADGVQALAAFEQNRKAIKVVVTDIMMPHMDGIALIRAIKKIDQKLPIIASSGLGKNLGRNEKCAELESVHIDKFLMKPYSAETLLGTLGSVLIEPRKA